MPLKKKILMFLRDHHPKMSLLAFQPMVMVVVELRIRLRASLILLALSLMEYRKKEVHHPP
jgi:hypothetical protein